MSKATVYKKTLNVKEMSYLFTSESVSEGHPDKVADQISDAILDAYLAQDAQSHVACETLVTTGLAVVSGEITSTGSVDITKTVRDTIRRIGYNDSKLGFDADSCGVISAIHEQSPNINQGVTRKEKKEQGAGDQGMMFGYACRETREYMPLPITLAHMFMQEIVRIRKEGRHMKYLRPDAKCQITVEYSDNNQPIGINTVVISTQHDDQGPTDNAMLQRITDDVRNILIPRMLRRLPQRQRQLFQESEYKLLVNPTGKFIIGGPCGDTGLTGRKIIVDTYGGRGAHGGGAFSGKDASKVDRSAAYAMRHMAKNMVAAGLCDEVLTQVAYAIGVAEPVGLYVNTYGTAHVKMTDGEIAQKLLQIFDLRPYAIIDRFDLTYPIYLPTAANGHMGRDPYEGNVTVVRGGKKVTRSVKFFAWEELDYVEKIQKAFGIEPPADKKKK